jgi:hypothetical protein
VPLVDRVPLQPPDAVHADALAELQLKTAAPPVATTAGVAVSTAVGTTLTVMLAGLLAPPGPVQVSEYVVLMATAGIVCEPLADWVPLQPPEASQEVALVELHVSVVAPPAATTRGFAVIVAVAVTFTVALAGELVPPGPVQVRT